jgi:taurine dioxygenase
MNIYEYVKKHGDAEKLARVDRELGQTEHPLVIRHPHTGRTALFLTDNFLERIIGLNAQEGAALLALLRAQYDNPNFHARMRWSPGCMAIWDQRAVNHRGLSDHYPTHPYRTMKSTFIGDGIPAAGLAIQ